MRLAQRGVAGSVVGALVMMGAVVALAAPAQALSAGLGFTADDLPTWQTDGIVYAVAASGSTVFAGGAFGTVSPPVGGTGTAFTSQGLIALDATTGVPTSCRPVLAMSGGTPEVRALTMSPDGSTLYIGGEFTSINGVPQGRLAALDVATCTVKTSFRPTAVAAQVRAIAATADSVYFGGDFGTVASQTRLRFAAVSAASGALLPWVADADQPGRAIAVAQDGRSVGIGGDFFTVNGQDSHSFAIVDPVSGANIQNFPRGFVPDTSVTKGITADATSYYVSNEGTGGGVFDGSFAVDYSTYQQRWRDLCLGATQASIVDQGVVYQANHHHNCNVGSQGGFPDGARVYLTAERADNMATIAWRPRLNDGIGEGIGPLALAIAHVGLSKYLWVGGEFTQVNGKVQQSLTRFANAPDTGVPPVPTPRAESVKAGQVHVSWRTSQDDDDGNLTYMVYRNSSTTPIATISAESRWWTRPQASFTDTTVVPGQTYSYRLRVTDGTNLSGLSPSVSITASTTGESYASSVLNDGATLYWRYNDPTTRYGTDTTASDHEPNYMLGRTHQSTTDAANGSGYAMSFDGSTGYAYSDSRVVAPTVYSVETWFRTTSTTGGKIVGYGDGLPRTDNGATNLSSSYDRHVYMTNDGRLIFGVYNGATTTLTTPTGASYNDGQWHQVVATQGSGGMALYVDGLRVSRNSVTTAQNYVGTWRVAGDNLAGWPSRPTSNYFAGDIDETSVYPAVLSATQVRQHFQASGRAVTTPPAPTDSYGAAVYGGDPDLFWRLDDSAGSQFAADSGIYANKGTLAGGVTTGTTGVVPGAGLGAATFSGNGTITSANSVSNPTNYSLELWFATTSTQGGKLIGFGDRATGLSSNYDRHVYLTNSGQLVFGTWTGSTNTITTPSTYRDGAWHQVVATQSTTAGMKLYVDGQLVGSNPQTGAQSYTGYWKVGGDPTWGSSSPYFTGKIDEVAVYGSVLDQSAVTTHYLLGKGQPLPDTTPPTVPSAVNATVSSVSSVDVSWTGSTDDSGTVAGYSVYRSTDPAFVPSNATKVTDVTVGTTLADVGVAPGTYYYKVTAYDPSGNASAASIASAAATVLGPDVTPPSAPTGVVATVTSLTSVGLVWNASTDDRGAIASYQVHRSTSPDFVPSAGTQIADVTLATSYSDAGLAPGTYYYKVIAVDPAANMSAPSAATAGAVVLGPDVTAPSVPTGVQASVLGDSAVAVSWNASTDDRGQIASYTVFRGGSADFAPTAGSKVADVTSGTSFADNGLAAGTYYYKVIAVDPTGNASASSDASAAAVVLGPDTTAPSVPTAVQASVSGTSVQVSWSASTDDRGTVASYAVYRSTTAGFTPSPSTKLADVTSGTSYADTGLAAGTYYYKVSASDPAGNISAASDASGAAVVSAVQPVTIAVFPVADSSVNEYAKTKIYGPLTSNGVQGKGPINISYLAFDLPAAPAGTVLSSATLQLHTTTETAAGSVDPFQAVWSSASWDEASMVWATQPTLTSTVVGTFPGNTTPNSDVVGTLNPSVVSQQLGTHQSIALTATNPASTDGFWFYSKEKTQVAYRPVLTLMFTPLPAGADTTAPSVPTAVQASVSGTSVQVSWSASTDDRGTVASYAVYRSTTAGFTPSPSTKLADVTSGTSYADTGLAAGTYYYKVSASDPAGNTSAASAASGAAVVIVVQPVTIKLSPVADSSVNEYAKTKIYGPLSSYGVQGKGPINISYLAFDLPAAPAGTVLSSATLQLRTTTDTAAGSVDPFQAVWSSASWDEASMVWATQPTLTSTVVGTFPGNTTPNSFVTGTLDPAVLTAQLGTHQSIALTATNLASTDGFWFYSRETATVANRPILTLTFTPAP